MKWRHSILIHILVFLFFGNLLISCQDLTITDREFDIPPIPQSIDDGLQVSSLADQGIDPDQIARLAWEIRNGDFDEIQSLVIIRNGYLVFEDYFEEDHDMDYLHRLASVTKSVISLIVGTAIQEGYITDHYQPLYEFFPGEDQLFEDQAEKRKLLLWHALTMSAGWRWKEGIGGDPSSDGYTMDHSPNSVQFVLSRPIKNKPGNKFVYNDGNTLLAAAAVSNMSGMDFEVYADSFLFQKLDIPNYTWEHQSDGFIRAGGGLHLTNRDMAKIGLLCLNNGSLAGEQIIPEQLSAP